MTSHGHRQLLSLTPHRDSSLIAEDSSQKCTASTDEVAIYARRTSVSCVLRAHKPSQLPAQITIFTATPLTFGRIEQHRGLVRHDVRAHFFYGNHNTPKLSENVSERTAQGGLSTIP